MSTDLWLRAAGYQLDLRATGAQLDDSDSTPLEYEQEWPVPPGVQATLMLDDGGRYVLEFKTTNQDGAHWMLECLNEWRDAMAGDSSHHLARNEEEGGA